MWFVILAIAIIGATLYLVISPPSSSIAIGDAAPTDNNVVSDVLKIATKLKKEGRLEDAIETLKSVYSRARNEPYSYKMETFTRLPLYMQKAGMKDGAWKEFERLLIEGNPRPPNDTFLYESSLWSDRSVVLDKMRIFLQREQRYVEAIAYGVLSYVAEFIFRTLDPYISDTQHYFDDESIRSMLLPLMKKAKRNNVEKLKIAVLDLLNRASIERQSFLLETAKNDLLEVI